MRDRSDDMDKRAAIELAARLHEQLGGKVLRVRAEQTNPYSGDASIGWAARVVCEDGAVVDIIGNEASGYQRTDRSSGWVGFDAIVADLLASDEQPETSPPSDDDLVERVTKLAVVLADAGAELRAIRDELVLRGKR